jgi:hypothetical protein
MDATAISQISQRQKAELRASLFSLAVACPVDECNPEDCPLFAVRKMKPAQRLQWLDALSETDLSYLATYHHVCLKTKLALKAATTASA